MDPLEESKHSVSLRRTLDVTNPAIEKHRLLLSIMVGISSHVIFNGKVHEQCDLEDAIK